MHGFNLLLGVTSVMHPKSVAPGEARTHGLQIMRLTRCLLRYGGLVWVLGAILIVEKLKLDKHSKCLSEGGFEPPPS